MVTSFRIAFFVSGCVWLLLSFTELQLRPHPRLFSGSVAASIENYSYGWPWDRALEQQVGIYSVAAPGVGVTGYRRIIVNDWKWHRLMMNVVSTIVMVAAPIILLVAFLRRGVPTRLRLLDFAKIVTALGFSLSLQHIAMQSTNGIGPLGRSISEMALPSNTEVALSLSLFAIGFVVCSLFERLSEMLISNGRPKRFSSVRLQDD